MRSVSIEAGLGETAVKDIVSGKSRDPGVSQLSRLAEKLEVRLDELLLLEPQEASPRRRMVPLVGYVGAGEEAHFYAVAQDALDYVEGPEDSTETTKAAEVRGQSLGALFERWLVFYDDERSPVTPDLHGQLCVVQLPNDKVLVKKIKPARGKPGLYDLLSNTEDTIHAQEIVWAAKVKSMAPR